MKHEWKNAGGESYRIEGDPGKPDEILIHRDWLGKRLVNMSEDEDGAAVCLDDVMAELLRAVEENLRLKIEIDSLKAVAESRR